MPARGVTVLDGDALMVRKSISSASATPCSAGVRRPSPSSIAPARRGSSRGAGPPSGWRVRMAEEGTLVREWTETRRGWQWVYSLSPGDADKQSQ